MNVCKEFRNDCRYYTYYIEYYLKPWFESLRRDGRLKKGKKQITMHSGIVEYSGEILDGEKATGDGEYTDQYGSKYSGHFVNDKLEG